MPGKRFLTVSTHADSLAPSHQSRSKRCRNARQEQSGSSMNPSLTSSRAAHQPSSGARRSLWWRLLEILVKRPDSRHQAVARKPVHCEPAQACTSRAQPQAASTPTLGPITRSVPVPIEALTQMLNVAPTMRTRLRHLALVEHSCLRSPAEPFAHLPPRAIEIAVRQLDAVLPRHPTLRVLRLQLERHLQTHRTRTDALLAAADLKWLPEGAVATTSACLAPDSMIGGPWGVTDFLETLPFERPVKASRHGHSSSHPPLPSP